MQRVTRKEEIGSCLLLLTFFSMQFIYEVMNIKKNYITHDISPSFFTVDNILLVMIPTLIYLSFKAKSLFLKFIYLLSTFPFLFTSSIFNSLNIKWLYYLNIAILFIIIVCMIKYIVQEQ